MRKLFLLEDDLSLISGLTFAFKKQGFALDTARTLAEAEVLWSDRKYDLLVLDVSLPDGSGFDFCQKVRRTSNVPILFLTASDEEMNIIMGLELGGDDYLTKPFKLGVLCHGSMHCFAVQMRPAQENPYWNRAASPSGCCRGRHTKTEYCWN